MLEGLVLHLLLTVLKQKTCLLTDNGNYGTTGTYAVALMLEDSVYRAVIEVTLADVSKQ